ncbi:PfkB family carbohydrate kinase [Methylophilus sp. 5]|uniref:PfkB family carbohydrate kinase n=1 Tax=Methylophilus sp. 5 TaxID=1112274 RepID=UPI00048FF81C|nr:PfkB family carbohydrate kinase [Methylophilus sp. 5]
MSLFVVASFIQACCWRVERLPLPGESVASTAICSEPGGKGFNVAIAASRLGAPVSLLVGLGEDAAADAALDVLQQHAIAPIYAYRLAAQSGHGAGFVAADGANMISVYLGPNQLLNATHVADAQPAIQSATLVYAQFETSLPAIQSSFDLARQAGRQTVLNPSPWQPIPQALLLQTTILILNQHEAAHLLAWSAEQLPTAPDIALPALKQAMRQFYQAWPGALLVVTLGALGSVAMTHTGAWIVSPVFAVNAIDTLGAGDAFSAGLCVALLRGEALQPALAFANACGACVVQKPGVLAALPDALAVAALHTKCSATPLV